MMIVFEFIGPTLVVVILGIGHYMQHKVLE